MTWLMLNQHVPWEHDEEPLLISVHSAMRSLVRVMTEHAGVKTLIDAFVQENQACSKGAYLLGCAVREVDALPSTSQQMPPAYRVLLW